MKRVISVVLLSICAVAFARDSGINKMSNLALHSSEANVMKVTPADYTLERWFTNSDYDGAGAYNIRLFHQSSEQVSVFQIFKLYRLSSLSEIAAVVGK